MSTIPATSPGTAPLRAAGGCLCGAVRYEVRGELRDVVDCHCAMCRRTHGHVGAYTAAVKTAVHLTEARGLKWFRSSPAARRGFCAECGGTLFWEPSDGDTVSIAAGTLDPPTRLTTVLQIYVDSAGDYYTPDPRIPLRTE